MSAHTPGPWRIVDNTDLDGGLWIVVDHDEVGPVSIAAVRQGCDEARELGSNKANAHLIASAPDMIEALSAALGYMRNAKIDLETGAPKKTAIQTLDGGIKLVEAALSKARPVLTGGTEE